MTALLSRLVLTCFLVCLAGMPRQGAAATLKDIKIALHIIDFRLNPLPGNNGIGIVFDGTNKQSTDDAHAIFNAIQTIPSAPLPPVLIDIHDLENNDRERALFIADQMRPYYDRIAAFGRASKILVLSSDLDCARAGLCTVSVSSSPRVEVIVSAKQAQASLIEFSEAFRMMVTEY